jgi:hypothetical protein
MDSLPPCGSDFCALGQRTPSRFREKGAKAPAAGP